MQRKLFNHDVLRNSSFINMTNGVYTAIKVSFQGIEGEVMSQTMEIMNALIGQIYFAGVTVPFGFCGYSSVTLFDFSDCGIDNIQNLAEQCAKDITGHDVRVECNAVNLAYVTDEFDCDKPTYCYVFSLLQQDMALDILDMTGNSNNVAEKGLYEALMESDVNLNIKGMHLPFGALVVCTACKDDSFGGMWPDTNYEPWNNDYKYIAVHSKTPFVALLEDEQDWVEYWIRDCGVEF